MKLILGMFVFIALLGGYALAQGVGIGAGTFDLPVYGGKGGVAAPTLNLTADDGSTLLTADDGATTLTAH